MESKRASQNIAAKNKLERYNKGTPLFGCSTEGKKPIYLLIPVRNKDEVLYVQLVQNDALGRENQCHERAGVSFAWIGIVRLFIEAEIARSGFPRLGFQRIINKPYGG